MWALKNVSTVLRTSCLVTDGHYYCDLVTNGMSTLGLMCDAEKDWHYRFFYPFFYPCSAINGCYKIPPNEPEIKFSFFIFDPPVAYFYKIFYAFGRNSILFCLLEYHLRIFIVSCANSIVLRQSQMQPCPPYQDQVVLRFFFYENSTLLRSKFYIC